MDWLDVEIKKIPGLTWTPVRTKSRQEKKLAQYCELQSVITYLPLKKRMKRYQRRMVETFIPMFPGYVFCALDEEGYNAILPSGTIVYRINMTPALEERLIEDLIALRDFERVVRESEVIVKPELVEGVRVRVERGPLRGVTGVIEKRGDSAMLFVGVEILGQSASTRIDIEDVELED